MLRCREVAERADRLIDGELGHWERLNMKLHLVMCRGCRAFIQQMRATQKLTREADVPDDTAIGDDIMAALAQRRAKFGKRP